jgi:WGR domain
MRWGRVGYKGQNSWTVCEANLERAKEVFTKKFADKTRNEWGLRDCFEKVRIWQFCVASDKAKEVIVNKHCRLNLK